MNILIYKGFTVKNQNMLLVDRGVEIFWYDFFSEEVRYFPSFYIKGSQNYLLLSKIKVL